MICLVVVICRVALLLLLNLKILTTEGVFLSPLEIFLVDSVLLYTITFILAIVQSKNTKQ